MRIRCNGDFFTSIITCIGEGHIIQCLKEKKYLKMETGKQGKDSNGIIDYIKITLAELR